MIYYYSRIDCRQMQQVISDVISVDRTLLYVANM